METKYIAYYRVSTKEQGKSGLGLEAQKQAVNQFTQNCKDCVLAEFTEVETGTSKKHRPQFEQAKQLAMSTGATIIIAKLDRLSRNVHFISGLMESKVKFKALDMPEADDTTVQMMAVFAEREAKMISQRTKAALAARKAKGLAWNGKNNLTPEAIAKSQAVRSQKAKDNPNNIQATALICALRRAGDTFPSIVEQSNNKGFKTSRGKNFQTTTVRRLYKRECCS